MKNTEIKNDRSVIGPKAQFTYLTVLEEAPRRGRHRYWLCQCKCGNLCEVEASHLLSGHTKSCGCDGQITEKAGVYLTASEIERFLLEKLDNGVSPAAVTKYKNALAHLQKWLGDDLLLTAENLRAWRQVLESGGYSKYTVEGYVKRINNFLRCRGDTELCIPKPARNDLTGRTFGYLTAIAPTEKRHHKYVVWQCVCKCGKEVEVPSGMLLGNHTTSCGCLNMEILQHCNRYEEGTELRQALEEKIVNPNSASGYVGVSPKRGKWVAQITYKKQHYYLGTFSNIEDAVKARARAKEAVMEDAARIYAETDHLYQDKPTKADPPERIPIDHPEPVIIPTRRNDNTSGYPGVSLSQGRWVASISVDKYRYRLGAYDKQKDAIAARKRAEALVLAGNIYGLQRICTNRKRGHAAQKAGEA